LTIIQDLEWLKKEAFDKEEENGHFRSYLRARDSGHVDIQVHKLNEIIAPQVDCTACGNCCKSLMVNITPAETQDLAAFLAVPIEELKEKFIETSQQGDMILNRIPCHFLSGTRCSIYTHRFTECREFPHLHRDHFADRLFGTLIHYGACPIIYNVVEQLKIESGFFAILPE
jgi:uncharacterized protein